MLSIINPSDMASHMSCCAYAPFCAHSNRQSPPHPHPSLSLGHTGESSLWNNRMPTPQQTPYSFNRQTHVPLFPSQTLEFLNNQDKLRAGPSTYSASHQVSSWSTPSYPVSNHDYGHHGWIPPHGKESLSGPGPGSFPHERSDYDQGIKYESLDIRDVSPSRATDFSTVSASSQASPAPATSFLNFSGLRVSRDESPFLSSQPLPPEHLCAAGSDARRMSVGSLDSDGPLRKAKIRSRQGSEPVQCHICHKSFDRRSNFKSHWETHDKDRQRTVCKIDGCTKTFGRPAEMTRHVNSAHRQKSFPCASCGKEFTRHDILLRHCKDACPVLVKGKGNGNGKKRRSKTS